MPVEFNAQKKNQQNNNKNNNILLSTSQHIFLPRFLACQLSRKKKSNEINIEFGMMQNGYFYPSTVVLLCAVAYMRPRQLIPKLPHKDCYADDDNAIHTQHSATFIMIFFE